MTEKKNIMDYETVELDDQENALVIIDQTKLPGKTEILRLKTAQEMWDAIYLLQVRGAPAIGVAAAFGIYLLAKQIQAADFDTFYSEFRKQKEYLDSSRPTAVNLSWALNRMEKKVTDNAGCDRVAANGDTANKIGTSSVAIAAKYYHIPVYICAPTSTIDMGTATGADIHIEERPAEEVTEMWYKERMAPEGVKVFNPAFDVTDHDLIAGIVTEYGIATAPFDLCQKGRGEGVIIQTCLNGYTKGK